LLSFQVRLQYRTAWDKAFLHFTADGREWTPEPVWLMPVADLNLVDNEPQVNVSKCFKMFQNVSKRFKNVSKMFQNVSKCFKMFQIFSERLVILEGDHHPRLGDAVCGHQWAGPVGSLVGRQKLYHTTPRCGSV
jgi:hypothetical protein